ncbi:MULTISPECIES: hypothetical protein [Pseudoalteromonas]|uniref:Lantibiotic n=1 Tax=Pseudoalteromonas piscicida TaxID=43662 RepID=A0ABM6N9L1_PSEO7|nr:MULTISPECIES: hypothetical protein [Pseudoalteromonas]ATD05525.1 hypothetical protein PPIS_a0168 [Pseudoalteromonas piscicida]MCO7199656.1 hypothetical protein [Pseudoalteromonas sp. OANN1]WPU32318.1 hypothetical protein SIO17_00805 [Pseudoalteromonas piscicida]
MKLTVKKLKSLSKNSQSLDYAATPNVAGGYTTRPGTIGCETTTKECDLITTALCTSARCDNYTTENC